MKIRKLLVENRSVDIFDDMIPFSEQCRLYYYALRSKFSIGGAANKLPENAYMQNTLYCEFTPEEIKTHGFISIPEIREFIKSNNYRIQKYYLNLGTSSDLYAYHVDNINEGGKTILCYLNTKWSTDWEGETHFSDSAAKEVLASVSFIPGRVVIFDSLIPHKASQPSFNAEHYRMVLAVKLIGPEVTGYDNCIDIEEI